MTVAKSSDSRMRDKLDSAVLVDAKGIILELKTLDAHETIYGY
jgi:hypothetical protein